MGRSKRVSRRSLIRAVGRASALTGLIVSAGFSTAAAQTQPVAGPNVNMVAGTTWPGGDPFLQRQNEPSLAVSSRNALHLLAGANDYRTVDLPVSDTVPGSLAGDAWLGVFKSYDGGLSWQSYLLPGYPQDQSAAGLASPLKAYNAAADPTVRAGTSGLLYYSGIAFNRGTNNGSVFVSTFFDTNQKENGAALAGGDSMQYQRTVVVDTGTSGQFLDKTWIAVDIPRAGGGSCVFPGLSGSQTILAGNVYLVWSRFTGSDEHEDHVLPFARLRKDLVEPDQALRVELDQPGDEPRDRPGQRQRVRGLAPVQDLEQSGVHSHRPVR